MESFEPRQLMAGDLVSSFGAGGTVALTQNPTHVFTQRDGRIVVVRDGDNGATPSIRRFLPDGTPDASFPADALLEQLTARLDDIGKFAMDDADRLLVGGANKLARVTPGGRIDPTFGKRGVIHLAYWPREIAVLDNGAIVTTGEVSSGGDELFFGEHFLTLLTPEGRIDTRFGGGDGTIEIGQTSRDDPFTSSLMYASDIVNEQIVSLPNDRFLYLSQMSVTGAQPNTNAIGATVIRLADGSVDTTFNFDRTNVLTQDFTNRFVNGEGRSRDGRLLDGAMARPDGSIDFIYTPVALGPAGSKIGTLTPDGSITNVRDFGDDASHWPIRDPRTGALYLPDAQGTSITRFTAAGVEEGTLAVALPDPGGAWVPLAFASDGNLIAGYHDVDNNPILLGKIHATDAPTGTFWGGPIRAARATSYRFTVTWDDPDGIDASTLSSRAIVIDLPDGSTRTAVFESATPSTDADTVVATYHLRSADGAWDASDNGRYQVRLRGKQVADNTGQRALGRVMGEFFVDVAPGPVIAFVPPRAMTLAPRAASSVVAVRSLLKDEDDALA
jgi:hypothetical protein